MNRRQTLGRVGLSTAGLAAFAQATSAQARTNGAEAVTEALFKLGCDDVCDRKILNELARTAGGPGSVKLDPETRAALEKIFNAACRKITEKYPALRITAKVV